MRARNDSATCGTCPYWGITGADYVNSQGYRLCSGTPLFPDRASGAPACRQHPEFFEKSTEGGGYTTSFWENWERENNRRFQSWLEDGDHPEASFATEPSGGEWEALLGKTDFFDYDPSPPARQAPGATRRGREWQG